VKATRSRSSALALFVLAGCRQILGIEESQVAKDALPDDVLVADMPVDDNCKDTDADGVCNDVDVWPCGAEPAALPAIATWDEVNGNNHATIRLSGATLDDTRALVVAPGATVMLRGQYSIIDCVCPDCLDQIEVGFAPNAGRQGCIYHGNPAGSEEDNCEMETTGMTQRTMVAPLQPGAYTLRFRLGQDVQCGTQTNWWSNSEPPVTASAVHLCVTPP
jgi:hypothetical protein